jgi:hypothetical protein
MPKKKLHQDWIDSLSEKAVKKAPEGYEGFVYIIENLTNNKIYIGKKSFYSYRKKKLTIKEKALPENKRKKFKIDVSETNWQSYTGSCKELNEDLAIGHKYIKKILQFCKTRRNMTAWELKFILCSDCLQTEGCYNKNVLGKIFSSDYK